jgi:hypothetical protein
LLTGFVFKDRSILKTLTKIDVSTQTTNNLNVE